MPRKAGVSSRAWKLVDLAMSKTAGVAFDTLQFFNKFNPNPSFTPNWSEKPLLKSWEKTKPTLGWPRRQLSVQFSGGEPTMHPYFLDAIRYARKLGYNSVQAATNGIEFAKNKEFCRKAFEAGLRYAYLQFDGIGNDANSHRQVGNLFDVKLRAIENMHEA